MDLRFQKYLPVTGISLALYIFVIQLSAQISPGDLAEAHAHLEGLSNCTKCHTLKEKVSNEKCIDCHTVIGKMIAENRGYHASTEVVGKECAGCHNDHHGRKFQLIRFDTDNFNHSLTGYTLQGAHATKDCRSCHKSEFITDREIKQKSTTYLGLDQKCQSCHTDYHQGTLASDCGSCHDFNAFRPASKFDHNNARFKLLGKHASVDCYACHKLSVQEGKEMRIFTGISFGKCTSCHRDVHENKFGQNCTQCHTVESFHQVKGMSDFNHARTNYPLEGKHRQIACVSCHKKGYTTEIRHDRCTDCHIDYHNKQFIVQGRSPDCSDCHSTSGFDLTSYTIERHNSSQFQLAGAHLATPCFDCHKKNDKWIFREIGNECVDCHKNIHASFLDAKYYPEETCANCHTSSRWGDIEFDHSKTGYKLEGAHQRQNCRSCHFKENADGAVVQQFSGLSSTCTNCHRDAHNGQFEDKNEISCLKCHGYSDWSAGMFRHDSTAFPLDGKHRDVACAKCHSKVVSGENTFTLYKLKIFTCESCH